MPSLTHFRIGITNCVNPKVYEVGVDFQDVLQGLSYDKRFELQDSGPEYWLCYVWHILFLFCILSCLVLRQFMVLA